MYTHKSGRHSVIHRQILRLARITDNVKKAEFQAFLACFWTLTLYRGIFAKIPSFISRNTGEV